MEINNKFTLLSINDNLCIESAETNNQFNSNLEINYEADNMFSVQSGCYRKFDDLFKAFQDQLCSARLNEKQKDMFFSLSEKLLSACTTLFNDLLEEKPTSSSHASVIAGAVEYVTRKLRERSSKQKRKKILDKCEGFVEPKQFPLGLKWKTKIDPTIGIPSYELAQCNYPYVSIIDTLRSKFLDENFKEMYIKHNSNPSHICSTTVYRDFCCGKIYKQTPIFRSKYTIQIQLSIDDFEPCQALKSKSGIHKICGIYFDIRNLPEYYRSKNSNISLVALVNVIDLKDRDEMMDRIIARIVDELKTLETVGLEEVIPNENIKAALVNVCADNLGANDILGFVKCFRARHFCRICECDNKACQALVCEDVSKIRKASDYQQLLQKIDHTKKNYVASKGLVKYCLFNELQSYNIFVNSSADIMHDINEGIIPFFISTSINFIVKHKIAALTKIEEKIRDYNYGYLWTTYKPSQIKLGKRSVGQNAMQSLCLMLHLPLILIEFKPKLAKMWEAMQDLLAITRIVYSACIREEDIVTKAF